jgi:hypothetical protein
MAPQIQYLLMMAQRFGNTPIGQMFQQRAAQALERMTLLERNRPPQMMDPITKRFMQMSPVEKTPYMPFSRGAAGLAGAGAVAAGSGQLEGVRDRLSERATAAPSIPPSAFGELDAIGGGREFRPLTIPASRSMEPGYEGSAGRRLSGEMLAMQPEPGYDMPPAARAAVSTARNIMPQSSPPPPRPTQAAPVASEPSSRALWERYGETESPADFVRADMAMRAGRADGGGLDPMGGLMPPDMGTMPVDAPLPMPADAAPPPAMDGPKAPAGGGAGGRDAAINKALDIIHRLITTQRV